MTVMHQNQSIYNWPITKKEDNAFNQSDWEKYAADAKGGKTLDTVTTSFDFAFD